jgi:EAL domain-containing protein (putative c-di-GMP-specific phosphodiesterase class I)
MGLEVIAEGVETVAQAETLGRLGCRVAQGYLFAKPLRADEIDELVVRPTPFASLVRASSPVVVEG